jgi:hypothetical protein
MVVAQENRKTLVKQLNRQLEEIYGKLFLRSSITWIAFPFASGSLAEFRVVYYPTDTLPFFMRCPAVLFFHYMANGVRVFTVLYRSLAVYLIAQLDFLLHRCLALVYNRQ